MEMETDRRGPRCCCRFCFLLSTCLRVGVGRRRRKEELRNVIKMIKMKGMKNRERKGGCLSKLKKEGKVRGRGREMKRID